jgi:hypothetical protein
MGRQEFEKYLRTKPDEQKKFSKEKALEEWRHYLEVLYGTIEKWVEDYVSNGIVQINKDKTVKLYEEFSGEYDVKAIDLCFHGKTILFEPVGTMLVGAKGRIDVKGKNGQVTFILVDKNLNGPNIHVNIFTSEKERKEYDEKKKNEKPKIIEWVWKILLNKGSMTYVKLDEDNFFDVLMELTND